MKINDKRIAECKGKHDPIANDFLHSKYDSLYSYCLNAGYTTKEYNSIYRYIKKYRPDISICVKNNGKTKRHLIRLEQRTNSIPTKKVLKELYVVQKKLMKEIANQFGVSVPTVCIWMKNYKIPARSNSEKAKMVWMDEEKRDHLRKMANEGKIGVFHSDSKWRNGKPTWIESFLMEWLDKNQIPYNYQWQFSPTTHRYDFRISDYSILVETDGLYFHNRSKQKQKDELHDIEAYERGFKVIRFTDKQIKETNGQCFERILHEIQCGKNER